MDNSIIAYLPLKWYNYLYVYLCKAARLTRSSEQFSFTNAALTRVCHRNTLVESSQMSNTPQFLFEYKGVTIDARSTLEQALVQYADSDMLERSLIAQTHDIWDYTNTPIPDELETIFWDRFATMGVQFYVGIYRAFDAPYDSARYLLLSDARNLYQPLTIDELIAFCLQQADDALEVVVRGAYDAIAREKVVPRKGR